MLIKDLNISKTSESGGAVSCVASRKAQAQSELGEKESPRKGHTPVDDA